MAKKSPLLETPETKPTNYSNTEEMYLGKVRARLEQARNDRDTSRPEWDGMSYTQQYLENERLAATYIKPRINKADTDYQSGVVRQKIFALLAAANRKNLEPEVVPYDRKGVPVPQLGDALTVVLDKTAEFDNDEEKRYLRQYELLGQGNVFVEEVWKNPKKTKKRIEAAFAGRPDQAKWTTQLTEYLSYPSRTVLDGRGVYLGDINQWFINLQPYIFTVDIVPYEVAKSLFGEWDRWDSVPHELNPVDPTGVASKYWTLTSPDKGMVEVIKYQDKWADEFQILLNGVMMLPVGYPLSAISPECEYTIVKQSLKVISNKFAYGKSLCMEMRPQATVFDEMTKLMVLKTQKSYMPPKANNTGKVLSQKHLVAGSIVHGVDGSRLANLDPEGSMGVTQSEFNALAWISQNLDELSVSKGFQGQSTGADTATENVLIKEQTDLMVDLILTAMSQLEQQLAERRLELLLEHWFNPIGEEVDEMGKLQPKYRTADMDKYIPQGGMGKYMVSVSTQEMTPEDLYWEEEDMSEKLGMPVRMLVVNPEVIKNFKYEYKVVVNPTERRGSNQDKLMFRAEIQDAMAFFPESVNKGYFQDRFADIWGEEPGKAFIQQDQMPTMAPVQTLDPNQGIPQPTASQAGRMTAV